MSDYAPEPENVGATENAPPAGGTGEAPPSAAAAPAEAPSWGGPSQAEWEQLQQFVANSSPLLGQLGELMYEPEEPETSAYDPNDPASVNAVIDQRVEAMIQERLGPFEPVLGQFAEERGAAIAKQTLGQLEGELGQKFDHDEAVMRARVFMASGLDPHAALKQAAQAQIQYDQRRDTQAVEAYKASLLPAAEAGGRPSPAATGPGIGAVELPPTPSGADRYETAIGNYFARRSPAGIADL